MPAISVLMPVYNAQQYLHEAMDSILKQTFGDFEFLVFDDGSTDKSREIIQSFNDPRIKVFLSEKNTGYASLLNEGLQKAEGKYIARMDADDVSMPDRFQKQFDFLERNPDYVLCGTWFREITEDRVANLPTDNDNIKLKMLCITPFCHPSVMMRAGVLKRNRILYEVDHAPAEDHELWTRLAEYGKLVNLPEVLVDYRVHDNNISLKVRTDVQIRNLATARRNYTRSFFKDAQLNQGQLDVLQSLFYKETSFLHHELYVCGGVIQRIVSGNHEYMVPKKKVHAFLSERFFYRCTTSTAMGLQAFSLATRFEFVKASFTQKGKLFLKALIKFGKK